MTMANVHEPPKPRPMTMAELRLGDEVEYLWVGDWKKFRVVSITDECDDAGRVTRTQATLHSAQLQRDAHVRKAHIDNGSMRWPMSVDQRREALLEDAKKILTKVAELNLDLRKFVRELA